VIRPRRIAFQLLGVVALVLASTAACGSPDEIDASGLERKIPAAVLSEHPELVTDVTCPRPIDRKVGEITACDGAIGGSEVQFAVTQLDDNGQVRVEVDRTLLDVDQLAARIAERLTADIAVPTSVLCDGPAVRVLSVGDEIQCEANDPQNRTNTFVATILDESANYELHIA
jgi:hypothetical protein